MTWDDVAAEVRRILPLATVGTHPDRGPQTLVVGVPVLFLLDKNDLTGDLIGDHLVLEIRMRNAASQVMRPGWLDEEMD
jgi:hypothetical protein